MKSILFHNFSWPTVISTLMTLASAITEYLFISRRCDYMLHKINKLITSAQSRLLRRAARILLGSDRHDEYFFNVLEEMQCGHSGSKNVIELGSEYSIVRTTRPAKDRVISLMEVNKHE